MSVRMLWSWRRWAYALCVVAAVTRIPARTHFHLVRAACDTRLTLENAGLSLTKIPHVILFAMFFLLTVVQFDRIGRGALAWSVVATAVLGLLIELEEGATRTGNCRLTDVLPDVVGALIGTALVIAMLFVRSHARPRAA